MTRKLVRAALTAAMAVVGLILALIVLYVRRGSLEMYPLQEDHDKVRVAAGALALLLLGMEIALWLLFRRLGRTRVIIANGRGQEQQSC